LDGVILVSYIQVSSRTCGLIWSKWVFTIFLVCTCTPIISYSFVQTQAPNEIYRCVWISGTRTELAIGYLMVKLFGGISIASKLLLIPGKTLCSVLSFLEIWARCVFDVTSPVCFLCFFRCAEHAMELSVEGQLSICWFLSHFICILVKLWIYNEMRHC
jgi:hypothetical protein